MKIKQLDILNIASIERANIDFDAAPLKDSDVFLITGKIGAGKSTILDAICLALYGTTPRINVGVRDRIEANEDGLTGRDPRQLMRQNTGEAYSRLLFEGTDGNSYEAEWQVQRGIKKKPTSALNADVWTLKNLTTGEVLTGSTNKDKGVREAVQKAVGLDFDQFCRTTMLAQGEFTKFLKSDEKEKASILEKITGTKIYSEVGVKIYEIAKKKKESLKQETDKMSGIKLLTQEEIQAKSDRMEAVKQENEILVKDWELCLGARRDMKDLNESQEEIKRHDAEISDRLKTRYLSGLKGKLWLEKQVQTLVGQQTALTEKLESQKDKAAVFEQSQTLLQLLKAIQNNQKGSEEKKKEKPKLDLDIKEAEKACDDKANALNAVKQKYADKESEVKADEGKMQSFALPSLRSQKETLAKTINAIDNLMTRWENHQHISAQIETLTKDIPAKQEALKAGKELLESLEKLKELSAQTVNQWAKQIRATLTEGCTCPVCQQTLQRALPLEEELDHTYQEHLKRYEAQRDLVQEQQNQLSRLSAQIQTLQQQLDAKRLLEDAAVYGVKELNQMEEILANTKQAKDDELYQLGLRIAEAEAFEKLLNEKKDQLNVLAKDEKAALNAKSVADQSLLNAQNALKNYETALQGFENSIKEASKEVDGILGDASAWPLDWHQDLAGFGNQLYVEAKQYQQDKDALKSTEIQLKEKDRIVQSIKEIQQKVLLRQADWNALAVDDAVEQQKIEEAWNEVYTALCTAQELKATAEKKKQQAEQQLEAFKAKHSLDGLEAQITAVEAKINTLKEESAALTKALDDDAALRKDKEDLQQRIMALTADYDQWKTLDDYFGSSDGSKFQKIAQSFILGNLLHSANSYLQSLHPRYSLEVIPGTLHISLVDAYQGYATRFVSTLSGGESFLVSLALALALADIGQNLAVDTLFIDEGFGSLSGQELTNAINTLRALHRANGRHVGIISHIEAVKDSIPVQIQVIQEGHHSSSEVRVEN